MGLGVVIAYSGISPIRILFISGLIGGLATPIGLVYLLLVAADSTLMGNKRIKGRLLIAGWTVTVMVSLAGLVYLVQQLSQ
jgi:Mn2+/Fe2+ NRAMP family transporter